MTREFNIVEINAADRVALKRFVTLERTLLGGYPLFTSEIDADIVKRLSGQSEFFRDNIEFVLYIATRDGRDVARCGALINRRYQTAKQEAVGFIGYFAAAPECGAEVAAMLARAESWLRDRGVTRVIAPCNGAAVMGMSLLTDAFDESQMFPAVWTPPYYVPYLTGAGFAPTYPLWFYTVDFSSPGYRALQAKAAERHTVIVRQLNKKKWNDELDLFRRLFNEAFVDEWEFCAMTSGEFHEFFDPIKPVLDTRQMLIAEVDGTPAGWCMGFPDWAPLFRSFKGKVGLVQILKLMLLSGRYDRAGLLGIGVLDGYKGTGVAQKLAATLYRFYEGRGMKEALCYPVNDHNHRSRRFAESIGGTGRILAHCYDKRPGTNE